MSTPVVALPLAVLLALAGPALAPQDWEEQVILQIEAIHAEIAADYSYASDLVIGEIEAEGSDGFALEISGDADYIIVGVCDTDCGDLDLAIYDPEEDQAAADLEYDDYPVLRVQGEGEFWVEVIMTDCAAQTCAYAVQVFVRDQAPKP